MSTFSLEQIKADLPARDYGFSAAEIEFIKRLTGHSIAEVECALICETLGHFHGNRTRAARVLGISIRALRNKIQDYKACGIMVPGPGHLH